MPYARSNSKRNSDPSATRTSATRSSISLEVHIDPLAVDPICAIDVAT